METQHTGRIVSWLFDKGFGFIVNIENGVPGKYYLHVSRIIKGIPTVGASVRFGVLPIKQGPSPTAIDAEIVDGGAL